MGKSTLKELTQEQLKKILNYNPSTGVFTWINKNKNKAGGVSGDGYWYIGINYKKYTAHRLAFLYMEGYFPEYVIDHINRIKTDNRWCNIRHVSRSCNTRNIGKTKSNLSGVVGVCWDKRKLKWRAQIKIDYKEKYLGDHKDFIPAVKARWEAEKKYKFPNCNSTSSAYLYLKENADIDKDIKI